MKIITLKVILLPSISSDDTAKLIGEELKDLIYDEDNEMAEAAIQDVTYEVSDEINYGPKQ